MFLLVARRRIFFDLPDPAQESQRTQQESISLSAAESF